MSNRNLDVQRNKFLSEQTTLISNPGTISTGKKTGTALAEEKVTIGSGALGVGVTVKAMSTNTGLVYLGINTVSSTTGFELSAGEQVFIPVNNLDVVYLDVAVTGEGVTYIGN